MNLTLTCKCGKKFRIGAEQMGQVVTCPHCGKQARAPKPPAQKMPSAPPVKVPSMELDAPAPSPIVPDDEGQIRLQELQPHQPAAPVTAIKQETTLEEVTLQPLTPPASPPRAESLEEAISLQPLHLPDRDPDTSEEVPMVVPVDEIEQESKGYSFDAAEDASGLETGTGVYSTLQAIPMDEHVPCIAYGAKGNWALAGQGTDVLIVNMKTKKAARFFEAHEADVTSVALSATEPLALSADDDGMMYLWDANTTKTKKRIRAHDSPILAAALSPNGKYAASGGEDSLIFLWDLATGKRRDLDYNDWDEWDEVVTYVAFARDSKKLLAGGSGGRISVWSVETGKRLKRYSGLDLPIACVRFSDEGGKLIATTHPVRAGKANYLVVCSWDADSSKPNDRFNIGIESTPCCMVPDRNGSRIIIAGGGQYPWMGVWSLERGQCKHIYDDLYGAPTALAVSPLNNRVLAALHNEQLQLFSIEPF